MIGDVRYAAAGGSTAAAADGHAHRAHGSSPPKRSAESRTSRRVGALVDMLQDNDGHDIYIHHAGSLALASHRRRARRSRRCRSTSRAPSARPRSSRSGGWGTRGWRVSWPTPTSRSSPMRPGPSMTMARFAAAVPRLAALLGETRFTSEPLLRRAINANLRVGSNEARRARRRLRGRCRAARRVARRGRRRARRVAGALADGSCRRVLPRRLRRVRSAAGRSETDARCGCGTGAVQKLIDGVAETAAPAATPGDEGRTGRCRGIARDQGRGAGSARAASKPIRRIRCGSRRCARCRR